MTFIEQVDATGDPRPNSSDYLQPSDHSLKNRSGRRFGGPVASTPGSDWRSSQWMGGKPVIKHGPESEGGEEQQSVDRLSKRQSAVRPWDPTRDGLYSSF